MGSHDNLTEYNRVPEESSIYSVGNVFCGSQHLGVLSHVGETKSHGLHFTRQKGRQDQFATKRLQSGRFPCDQSTSKKCIELRSTVAFLGSLMGVI